MTTAESFSWAFKDPQWPGKMLVQGLIVIIPIVGWIAMTGWMMMAVDNARAGKNELPPAGFHLERGIAVFLVFLVYGLVLQVPAGVFFGIGSAATGQTHEFGYSASPFFALGWLLSIAAALLNRFLIPAMILNTYREGLAGGLNVQKVWRSSTFNLTNTIIAALLIWVASVIGGLGIAACCIALIFTIPYENTITAGVVAWFDKEESSTAVRPAAPAA